MHEKARAEQLIGDARAALSEQAGLDRVRPLISDLQQILQALPAVAAQAAPTGGDANGGSASARDPSGAADVRGSPPPLHALPVGPPRGGASAIVVDGGHSVVWEQVGNRVHAEQAVVHALATQTASENVSQASGSPAV